MPLYWFYTGFTLVLQWFYTGYLHFQGRSGELVARRPSDVTLGWRCRVVSPFLVTYSRLFTKMELEASPAPPPPLLLQPPAAAGIFGLN